MEKLFGLSSSYESSQLILIPVPWEATTSYGGGTSHGPKAILNASDQIDLLDPHFGDFSEQGLYWKSDQYNDLMQLNSETKAVAQKLIQQFDADGTLPTADNPLLKQVNQSSKSLTQSVYKQSKQVLSDGKVPAVVGGDHSSPLGLISALSEHYSGDFSILHIDAHADLRNAYQGFEESHASIMFNVLKLDKAPKQLTSIGIRDYCQEEQDLAQSAANVTTFYNAETQRQLYRGESWHSLCEKIISTLTDKVYISFDIDGLSPDFCPNTGTPVPGGFSFDQISYLLSELSQSKRSIIGFDLCEVAPGKDSELDANIGMRVLYKLCGCTLA